MHCSYCEGPRKGSSSIILESTSGWIVSHFTSLNSEYHNCYDSSTQQENCFSVNPELFAIHEPYRMDSQHQAIYDRLCNGVALPRKKRRKRKMAELDIFNYHTMIKDIVEKPMKELILLGIQRGLFSDHLSSDDNNSLARRAGNVVSGCDHISLCDLAVISGDTADKGGCLLTKQSSSMNMAALVNISVQQAEDCPLVANISGESYLLPAKSKFLMSDLIYVDKLLSDKATYNLIVIDPPWENKSVKRKKKYKYLLNSDLFRLPVAQLAASGCIVAVWVTNKWKQINFVKEELFKEWNVTSHAVWHWVKVTTSGEMVHDFNSEHKKPYENLILGQFDEDQPSLPDHKIIVSVPCSVHSSKPHLEDLLAKWLPANPKCLELFARNLRSHWTSWGNEVLKLQHVGYFTHLKPTDGRFDPGVQS